MALDSTIVLLHGAGTGAWVWQRVVDTLEPPSVALEVPGRKSDVTPDSCAAELIRELDQRGETRVVLVLHSLAGVLASSMARRLGSRLTRCIFVSAVVPPDSGAFVDALPFPNRMILKLLFRLKRRGLKPSPAMIRRELCNDLTAEDAALVLFRYQAEMPGLYLSPTGPPPAAARCAYIKLLQDQSVPPALQDSMIARLGNPRVHQVDAGHLAMLSAPMDLSTVIASEALASGGAASSSA